jgi:hypothetical protein
MDGVGDNQIHAHQVKIEVQLGRRTTTRDIEVWLAHHTTEPLVVQQGLAEAVQTIVETGHLDIHDYFYPPDMPPSPES